MPMMKGALVRRPGENFAAGVTNANLGVPDFYKALQQHEEYCDALRQCGVEVTCLPADPRYPDCCFVEDTAIIMEESVIISNPGHPSRSGEIEEIAFRLKALIGPNKKFQQIADPGKLDGGDVLRFGRTLFVGLTERTNVRGAAQLAEFVLPEGFSVRTVPVGSLLHLKTGITRVNDETVVCVEQLADETAFANVPNRVVVPANELVAANCVALNGKLIMPAGCESARARVTPLVSQVLIVDISEFQKMDGGLTCLSLLW